MAELTGAHIVITGGGSGIGLATARRALALDAEQVVVAGRDADRLAAAAAHLGSRSTPLVLDVTDETAVRHALQAVGPFDHLVTAAAGNYRSTFPQLDTAAARQLFESKFWGQHHCVRHGAPLLRSGGSITLFSGWISRKPAPGTSTLAAVDGAIEALARVLSLELAPLRVNVVSPGAIDTPRWAAQFTGEQQREYFAGVAQLTPVGASRPRRRRRARRHLPDDQRAHQRRGRRYRRRTTPTPIAAPPTSGDTSCRRPRVDTGL